MIRTRKQIHVNGFIPAVALILLLLFPGGSFAASPTLPVGLSGQIVTNLRFPIHKHSNGLVKDTLFAERASIDTNGVIHAEGKISLTSYDSKGNKIAEATAGEAICDPKTEMVFCEGPVVFASESRGITLEGEDLTINSSVSVARLGKKVVLTIQRGGSIVEPLEEDQASENK